MALKLDRVSCLPVKQMRRLRLMGRPVRVRRKGGTFTREELVDYLRRGNLRSRRKFEKAWKEGDPLPSTYRKEFGSWGAAIRAAFGVQIVKPGVDGDYVVKSVIMMKVKTYEQYLEARRRNMDVFPSIYYVRKRFKTFGNLMYCVRKTSLEDALEAYERLWRRLGRAPLVDECKRAGVSLDMILELFDSKSKADSFMKHLENIRGRKNEG